MKRLLVVLRWMRQQSLLYWLACLFAWVAFAALVVDKTGSALVYTILAGVAWWLDYLTNREFADD